MSLIQKSNSKKLLSPSDRTKIHLRPPESTGYSVAEADACEANPRSFAEDFLTEHSLTRAAFVPTGQVSDSSGQQASAASKRARA